MNKNLEQIKKILIIIRRSNGDVLLASPLITSLYNSLNNPKIDLLVNDDTLSTANTLMHINSIYFFSYQWKKQSQIVYLKESIRLLKKIWHKYDLAISLTASDSSIFYASLSSKKSIGIIENNSKKNWWKKIILKKYFFQKNQNIILSNNYVLELLGLINIKTQFSLKYSLDAHDRISKKLNEYNIRKFIILHPSAQYKYKIYPQNKTNQLIKLLSQLEISTIITGSNTIIDQDIKKSIPVMKNIYNWIGETTLDEYIALSNLSEAYIGMDTLNMHIAAAQGKAIFAIFGPSILSIWAPWSIDENQATTTNQSVQTYGKITIFQSQLPCVPCGKAGCNDNYQTSECLENIAPEDIFLNIQQYVNRPTSNIT
jgi:heptosyltransferase-3